MGDKGENAKFLRIKGTYMYTPPFHPPSHPLSLEALIDCICGEKGLLWAPVYFSKSNNNIFKSTKGSQAHQWLLSASL